MIKMFTSRAQQKRLRNPQLFFNHSTLQSFWLSRCEFLSFTANKSGQAEKPHTYKDQRARFGNFCCYRNYSTGIPKRQIINCEAGWFVTSDKERDALDHITTGGVSQTIEFEPRDRVG